ncbi:MAG: hypothetical protein QNL08_01880 [Ilumatobacteraceae bacterium]|uniref:Uncharacterized protein n=1 Tax=Acidimicrobiia bacterium BACL6 MAG-120924-bin43 TaxID=1655583 RepID=A0A0R2QGY4_9ACTN|nr:MAG: hypothetical protein ABR75_08030 [Acidimicrobiia bacterium BACL6 MAG-120924-bin43]KRO54632.1 MAG: hypothetical protein ABR77_08225 [Acidimicrobiia bacterium BACL6 MAG-120322-bin79]
MIAISSFSLLFAAISVVSALTLVVMMMQESRHATRNNGMVAFRRHLDALSDDSRAHVRQQLQDHSDKKGRR